MWLVRTRNKLCTGRFHFLRSSLPATLRCKRHLLPQIQLTQRASELANNSSPPPPAASRARSPKVSLLPLLSLCVRLSSTGNLEQNSNQTAQTMTKHLLLVASCAKLALVFAHCVVGFKISGPCERPDEPVAPSADYTALRSALEHIKIRRLSDQFKRTQSNRWLAKHRTPLDWTASHLRCHTNVSRRHLRGALCRAHRPMKGQSAATSSRKQVVWPHWVGFI